MLQDYEIRHVSKEEFEPLLKKNTAIVFDNNCFIIRYAKLLSEEEKAKLKQLESFCKDLFVLRLGVFFKGEFVGWHFGYQTDPQTYYMCNSAILPEHRRNGLYSKLLEETLSITKEHGFQIIYSRHVATNNKILIAKLKQGFVITSMELTDTFGTMVHLSYYTNKLRSKILNYRAGQIKADKELQDLISK